MALWCRLNKKKYERILKKLKGMRGVSQDERVMLAWSLSATPDERWARHENFLRSQGLFTRSERRKFGFK